MSDLTATDELKRKMDVINNRPTNENMTELLEHIPQQYKKHFAIRINRSSSTYELSWILSNIRTAIDTGTIE